MLDFQRWFSFGKDEERRGSLYQALEDVLGELEEREAKYLTGLAGLLGRVAYSDREITSEELKRIGELLNESPSLSEDMVSKITDLVAGLTEELVGIEDHHYIRFIKESCDAGQRLEVLEALFQVAAVNSSISEEESHSIRNVAVSLGLSPRDFTNTRLKFREFVDLFKDLPS